MSIDIERLKVDPDYWDEVAPLGSTHHWWPSGEWYQDCGDYALAWIFGKEEWVQAIVPLRIVRPQAIPRPTKPEPKEWDGEGLPPVGSICEAYMMGKTIADKVLVMGYFDDLIWLNLQNWDEDGLYSGSPTTRVAGEVEFRTIRTQAEREREELVKMIEEYQPYTYDELADAIMQWMKDNNLTEK